MRTSFYKKFVLTLPWKSCLRTGLFDQHDTRKQFYTNAVLSKIVNGFHSHKQLISIKMNSFTGIGQVFVKTLVTLQNRNYSQSLLQYIGVD